MPQEQNAKSGISTSSGAIGSVRENIEPVIGVSNSLRGHIDPAVSLIRQIHRPECDVLNSPDSLLLSFLGRCISMVAIFVDLSNRSSDLPLLEIFGVSTSFMHKSSLPFSSIFPFFRDISERMVYDFGKL